MSPDKDTNGDSKEPASKKAKIDEEASNAKPAAPASTSAATATKQQSSLLSFFSSNKPKKTSSEKSAAANGGEKEESASAGNAASSKSASSTKDFDAKCSAAESSTTASTDAIVPTSSKNITATWQSMCDQHVLMRIPNTKMGALHLENNLEQQPHYSKRTKVAAFDMDGTLLKWISESPGFWPSRLEHYELWNSTVVIEKLRDLYDTQQNYRLVIFTNQGGIQKAHSGKRADLLKQLTEWLEQTIIKRPLTVIASTRSPKKSPLQSFHKPGPKMWTSVLMGSLKSDIEIDLSQSFFVGDSADEDDSQGGVDRKFAHSVGVKFYTPDEYFGPSSQELRAQQKTSSASASGGDVAPTPKSALQARAALLGGYLETPLMIILCGVQGSGKSTFCKQLLGVWGDATKVVPTTNGNSDSNKNKNNNTGRKSPNSHWVWLSQDTINNGTINNGKPGKREKVEKLAREALQKGNSVIIDRMHLDPQQRQYFVEVAKQCKVPAHVVLLNPAPAVVKDRVKNRTNHPGKVEGDFGVKLALGSMQRLVVPTYEEDVDLISIVSTEFAANQLALRYGNLVLKDDSKASLVNDRIPLKEISSSTLMTMPAISLGTMGIGKRKCKEVVTAMLSAGLASIDTAPTYKNEDKVGEALQDPNVCDDPCYVFLIAKVPKRAATPDEVKAELTMTLSNLQADTVDLLLLHWPCDVILQNTLPQVWKAMEDCVKDGKCQALGVCNFNQGALTKLLGVCTIRPVVNQVERHPLLPQMDLVDFCARNDIVVQAHTPLGQGSEALLGNEIIQKVAKETSLTAAQVVIGWNIQQDVAVVPKCTQEAHAKEILQLMPSGPSNSKPMLSPEHMKALDGLHNGTRFVAPPFMYGTNFYCWGEQMPRRK